MMRNLWSTVAKIARHLFGLSDVANPGRRRRFPSLAQSKIFVFLLLALGSSTRSALAVSLKDYEARVKNAITAVERAEKVAMVDKIDNYLADIRTALPPSQEVEWKGTVFFANNTWLHREIHEVESTKGSDPRRVQALTRARERLQALSERLQAIQTQGDVNGPSKAELKEKLAAILSRPEFTRNAEAESAIDRLLKRIGKWIESLLPKTKPISPGRANTISRLAQIFVVVLALGAIAYVLKLFLPRVMRGSRRKKKAKVEARVVLGEKLEPEQSAADLLAAAEQLARDGDLRGAIRKAYIALLVELGDRQIISLAQHKTNRDYLGAVRELSNLYPRMRQLTNSFEVHWYGSRHATEHDWLEFRGAYRDALAAG